MPSVFEKFAGIGGTKYAGSLLSRAGTGALIGGTGGALAGLPKEPEEGYGKAIGYGLAGAALGGLAGTARHAWNELSPLEGTNLWAQALDNSSPDHIYTHNALWDAHGIKSHPLIKDWQRQDAASAVGRAARRGKSRQGSHVFIQRDATNRDARGRVAPVVYNGSAKGINVDNAMQEFAQHIGHGELAPLSEQNIRDINMAQLPWWKRRD